MTKTAHGGEQLAPQTVEVLGVPCTVVDLLAIAITLELSAARCGQTESVQAMIGALRKTADELDGDVAVPS